MWKTNALQVMVYVLTPITFIYYWDPVLFVAALFFTWVVHGIGLSVGLHRYTTHGSFVIKNNFLKVLLLYLAVFDVVVDNVTFAAVHRTHHKYSDKEKDPHYFYDLWSGIKIYFLQYNLKHINPLVVKDLIRDPIHAFFNKHFFKIVVATCLVLLAIDIKAFLYFYVVTMFFNLFLLSYGAIWAHLKVLKRAIGYAPNNTGDDSFNNHIAAFCTMGEGYHNNHHAYQRTYKFAHRPGEFDIGSKVIELISIKRHDPLEN